MGIKTSHWKDQIDEITDDFNRIFEPLTPSELNWKPNPGTWSIAQNIDHLIVINESYFQVFAQLREGKYEKPFWARGDCIPSMLVKERNIVDYGRSGNLSNPIKSEKSKRCLNGNLRSIPLMARS